MGKVLGVIGIILFDILQTVVLAALVSMFIYLFVLSPHQVKGQSMFPTFHDKEYLLTDKLTYNETLRLGGPKRGDVVILKAPETESCAERNCEYIKRIMGLGGDRIKLSGGRIYFNGELLPEEYLPDDKMTTPGAYIREGVEVVIPQGKYLVMGDNRLHSRDGREFGPVARKNLIGKVRFRYWPSDRAGFIRDYTW